MLIKPSQPLIIVSLCAKKIRDLQKLLPVASDNSIDSLKNLGISLPVDVDAMAVSRMISQGHEQLKEADLLVHGVRKCHFVRDS